MYKYLVALVSIMVVSLACKKDAEIEISKDESYKKGRLEVSLLDVKDSRCPTQMACIWEGNAEVILVVNRKNQSDTIKINSHQKYPQEAILDDMKIKFIEINPYPETEGQYSLEEYNVKLKIEYIK